MEDFITILNKIQDASNAVGTESLKLPEIIAIGSQSCGKSSILESLVGKGFLPRGCGIVTRCPLVLQMIHVPETHAALHPRPGVTEWARFLHNDKIYEDWEEVLEEIEEQTARLCGMEKGISSTPITLKVYSFQVPTLTLVDLPGLTKIPIRGQPEDIESQIKNLVVSRISNSNSIILAVAAANQDLATSEALKLAREVDPEGNRTLVVVTKLDLMDAGTDATDLLSGLIIPVKLGIIGVLNRSQQDILDKKSLEESRAKEKHFLETVYPHLSNTSGTPHLVKKLTGLLFQRIKTCLPALKSRIQILTNEYQAMLDSCGEMASSKESIVLQVVNKFSLLFIGTLNGTTDAAAVPADINGVIGGAAICDIFYDKYSQEMDELDPLHNLSPEDILTAIKNSNGLQPSLFVAEGSFIQLASKQTQQFEAPSLNCVMLVYEELTRVVDACMQVLKPMLMRFPNLHNALKEETRAFLFSRVGPTKELVSNLVCIQQSYINSRHPDFLVSPALLKTGFEAVISSLDPEQHKEDQIASEPDKPEQLLNPSSFGEHKLVGKRDKVEINIIGELLRLYFRTVQRTINDCVPKSIMHQMVNYTRDHLQEKLTLRLLQQGNMDLLVKEAPQIEEKRQEARNMLDMLQEVSQTVARVKGL